MAVYGSRWLVLALGLLLSGYTAVQSASVRLHPEGCNVEIIDRPTPNQELECITTPTNINDVLYKMKQPQFQTIILHIIGHQFDDSHVGDEAFHPNLEALLISAVRFTISPGTFRGLSKLQSLRMKGLDNIIYKDLQESDSSNTTFPKNINYTSQLFHESWLAPLTNLNTLQILQSNMSNFHVEEFCGLNQLQMLVLSLNGINSTEGLRISCNSSSCTPCLPNVTILVISRNPINDFTIDISTDVPNLKQFDMSNCNMSVLNLNSVTTESIERLDASHNKLHSLLLDEEYPCNLPHLQWLLLDDNHLHIVSPGLFLCMYHLQILMLSGNALTAETLIGAGLNHLTELKWLDLSHNKIDTLQPALIGNMTELLHFQCTACSLTTIDKDTFTHIKNLKSLVLDNNYLSMIDAGSFSHFLILDTLNLSRNALNQITLTENLLSLWELDLSDNLLSAIPEFSGSWLNLSTLAMDRNQITHIGPQDMAGLTSLTNLSLASNRIELIPDKTFANQDYLEHLVLSSNRIKTISEFGLDRLPSLTHLSIDNNSLVEGPPPKSSSLGKLQFLNLSRNQIKTMNLNIKDRSSSSSSLRGIDLSHNYINQIKIAFLFVAFEYLEYVNFSYNQISRLNLTDMVTVKLPRCRVYLEGNPLHVDCNSNWLLEAKLDKVYMQIEEGLENSPKNVYYVKIADWNLLQGTTATGEIKSFSELSYADLLCPYTWICYRPDCTKGCCKNGMDCPCSTFCYAECTCYRNNVDSINFMNCSSRNLTSLPPQRPTYNVKSINLDGNFLPSLTPSSLNFPHLTELNASNSHISYLRPETFSTLKMLRILRLQQNKIEKISNRTFAFLINLEELYLQRNKIHQIDNGSFDDLVDLKVLWLHGNKLKHLHQSLFGRIYYLGELSLHDNPWSCDCKFGPAFKKWLIHSKIIANYPHIYCNNTVPSVYAGSESSWYNVQNNTTYLSHQDVIDVDFSSCTNRSIVVRVHNHTIRVTVHRHSKSFTEVVSLAALFAILVILTLVIYKTRLLLRVWFYNKFGARFHQEEDDNDDKPYDLFIAYAKADERLVMHELLPKLEGGKMSYKVCVECRDWAPGASTTDSVVASVQLSKRTVVLVSSNHLDTQWCEYSFDAAHYQILINKQIQLILVLTDIELEVRMTRAMKLYMKTNTFLVIGEKWFWKKLRYYLAVNPRGADHVVGREFRLMDA